MSEGSGLTKDKGIVQAQIKSGKVLNMNVVSSRIL